MGKHREQRKERILEADLRQDSWGAGISLAEQAGPTRMSRGGISDFVYKFG